MAKVQVTFLLGKGNSVIRREVERASVEKSSPFGHCCEWQWSIQNGQNKGRNSASHPWGNVGIVLWAKCSPYAYSRNIGINAILRDMCMRKGINFVDRYDHLFGRLDLFQRHGAYLSGKVKLVKMVEEACSRVLYNSWWKTVFSIRKNLKWRKSHCAFHKKCHFSISSQKFNF